MSESRARIIRAASQTDGARYIGPLHVTQIAEAAAAEACRILKERVQMQSYVAYQTPEGVIDALLSEIERSTPPETADAGARLAAVANDTGSSETVAASDCDACANSRYAADCSCLRIHNLIQELNRAAQEVAAATARQWDGKPAFVLSIPARMDRDSDLIISAAIGEAIQALSEIGKSPQPLAAAIVTTEVSSSPAASPALKTSAGAETEPRLNTDSGAALLPGEGLASPAITETLPNLDRARLRAFCQHAIKFDELNYWKCVNCGIEGHRENVYRKAREEYERAVVAAAFAEFVPYLKEGETPIQRLERERRDNTSLLTLLAAEKRKHEVVTPQPIDHYWTPDPTKRFCVICGDNGLGSAWGIHRFQIQPHDPDFKPQVGSVSVDGDQ